MTISRRKVIKGIAALPLSACKTAPTRLDPEQLMLDAAVLHRAYATLHPGLLRYNTDAQLEAHYATLRGSLRRDSSLPSAYLAFSQFAATLRCGHTYANFFNQTAPVRTALIESVPCVPFQFRWLRERMILSRNLGSDGALVPGDEIVSIDGVSTSQILSRLMTVARADGSNDAKRLAWLEVRGHEKVEAFDVFMPLLFPRRPGPFRLEVRDGRAPQSRKRTIEVDPLTSTQRRASMTSGASARETSGWSWQRPAPNVALLRMPTWALYNSTWDWRAFLQQGFETVTMSDVPNLVIDLRGNEGGWDVGREILAHLIDRDLALPAYRRLVRYQRVPDDLVPYLDTWDPTFRDWGRDTRPFDDRFLRLTRYDDNAEGDVVRPTAPRYRGRVFVLIGATNSSATFEFALQMKRARLGTLVGQTTGGNLRGINGGAFFFLRLPNSKIELDLPLIGQFPLEPQPDAGLVPDHLVLTSVDDIASGRDAELTAVISLA